MDVFGLFQRGEDFGHAGSDKLLGLFESQVAAEQWLEKNKAHDYYPEGDDRNFWWRSYGKVFPRSPFQDHEYNSETERFDPVGEMYDLHPNRVQDWSYFYIEKIPVQGVGE